MFQMKPKKAYPNRTLCSIVLCFVYAWSHGSARRGQTQTILRGQMLSTVSKATKQMDFERRSDSNLD